MDMPTKKRTVAAQAAQLGPLPEMRAELIEQLVTGPMSPAVVQTLFLSFKKAIIERAMSAEMNQHLGYRPGDAKPEGQANERNKAAADATRLELARYPRRGSDARPTAQD